MTRDSQQAPPIQSTTWYLIRSERIVKEQARSGDRGLQTRGSGVNLVKTASNKRKRGSGSSINEPKQKRKKPTKSSTSNALGNDADAEDGQTQSISQQFMLEPSKVLICCHSNHVCLTVEQVRESQPAKAIPHTRSQIMPLDQQMGWVVIPPLALARLYSQLPLEQLLSLKMALSTRVEFFQDYQLRKRQGIRHGTLVLSLTIRPLTPAGFHTTQVFMLRRTELSGPATHRSVRSR